MADQHTALLFVDDLYTALSDVVRALGGFKEVGKRLKPDKPADEAGRWLSDCLNREKRDKLDLDQIMWILKEGRRIGCHTAMHFMSIDAGYAAPAPVDPEEEAAQLQRQFVESVQVQRAILDRLEKLHPHLVRVA